MSKFCRVPRFCQQTYLPYIPYTIYTITIISGLVRSRNLTRCPDCRDWLINPISSFEHLLSVCWGKYPFLLQLFKENISLQLYMKELHGWHCLNCQIFQFLRMSNIKSLGQRLRGYLLILQYLAADQVLEHLCNNNYKYWIKMQEEDIGQKNKN